MIAQAAGRSKKEGEQEAARLALEKLAGTEGAGIGDQGSGDAPRVAESERQRRKAGDS